MIRKSGKSGSKLAQKSPAPSAGKKGRPVNWEPRLGTDGIYFIRPTMPDGKRPKFTFGTCIHDAREQIEARVKPLFRGQSSLDNGKSLFGDVIPQILDAHAREHGEWNDRDGDEARLKKCVVPVANICLKDIRDTRKFFSKIVDHARLSVGYRLETRRKLRTLLGRVAAVLYHEEWIDQYDLSKLPVGGAAGEAPVKRRAIPSPAEYRAFLNCEEVALYLRVDEALRIDMMSMRAGDTHFLTWEKLGAPDFQGACFFPNVKKARADLARGKKGTLSGPDELGWRETSWVMDNGRLNPHRALVRRYFEEEARRLERGGVDLRENLSLKVFPGRSAKYKGARNRRVGYMKSMGITPERKYYGKFPDVAFDPPVDEWTPRQRVLFLSGKLRKQYPECATKDRMDYHSTRSDFDTRLNPLVADEEGLEVLTSHTARVSKESYDESGPKPVKMPAAGLKAQSIRAEVVSGGSVTIHNSDPQLPDQGFLEKRAK